MKAEASSEISAIF